MLNLSNSPILFADTGQGFTNSYKHQVHTNALGTPCPVLCYMQKGKDNEKKVYQFLNDTRGFVITSNGFTNKITDVDNKIETWGKWDIKDLEKIKIPKKVYEIAEEVYSWKEGRICHFPPAYKGKPIVPEIDSPFKIPEVLHSPGMYGAFVLEGGGSGERCGSIYISKLWKLSMPYLGKWDFPVDKSIYTPTHPIFFEKEEVIIEEGRIKEIATIGRGNTLYETLGDTLATLKIVTESETKITQVGGLFRLGVISENIKEHENGTV